MPDQTTILRNRIDPDKLKMLGDYVLVKKHVNEESKGGLIIVRGEKSECNYGEVLRVGSGWVTEEDGTHVPLEVSPGDWVISMQYVGDQMHDNVTLEDYRIFREHAIWARVWVDQRVNDSGVTSLQLRGVEPLFNKVLVRITEYLKTSGGIYLSDNHQMQGYTMAEVIKVGKGRRDFKTGYRYPVEVNPGDKVCMLRYAGAVVPLDHESLRLIDDYDILYSEPKP